tara:strand:- start:1440 stop:1754 length:315 start_codon:yes stop_codon:yes gene_type:complete
MSIIKKIANDIATEIAQRNIMDIEGVSVMIAVKIKQGLTDIMMESTSQAQQDYFKLLVEQQKNLGTKNYIEFGYKLGLAKAKMKRANTAMNEVRRNNKLEKEKK